MSGVAEGDWDREGVVRKRWRGKQLAAVLSLLPFRLTNPRKN